MTRTWLATMLVFATVSGCANKQGDQSSRGGLGELFSASVNGLNVLGDMFTAAGNTVDARSELSPVLKESADVIIWAPDDFNIPDPDTCERVNGWLQAKANRTFVYIGRDFDARTVYWRDIAAQSTAADKSKYTAMQNAAEARFALERSSLPKAGTCDWFSIDGTAPHREIRTLGGPWAGGIDASKSEIELNSAVVPSQDAEQLLQDADGNMLVSQQKISVLSKFHWLPNLLNSNLIVVANGSFLFNEPLVNHEHRKLAGQLIDSIGKGKQVVILDSQNHNPFGVGNADSDSDSPEQSPKSMVDIFDVWPLSAILVQFGILIVLVCFLKWPIFGPPRDPAPPAVSDFGRHVDALGAAMAVTGDAAYAQARVQQYRQLRDAIGPRAINRMNAKKHQPEA